MFESGAGGGGGGGVACKLGGCYQEHRLRVP